MLKSLTAYRSVRLGWACVLAAAAVVGGCAKGMRSPTQPQSDMGVITVESKAATPRPPYTFGARDAKLLDDVQRGAFLYLWNEASPTTGMVYDRSSVKVVSVAGVGFQLSALPIGVERGWVTKAEAHDRAKLILSSLKGNPNNRKFGLFFHYLDPVTAGPDTSGYEFAVSTIDSALLFAGIMTVSTYFEADIKTIADELVREANWRAFVLEKSKKPYEAGFISLGWKPKDQANPTGDGQLLPYVWADAGDEQRLVSFLAVAAPVRKHAVAPEVYYKLRRNIGDDGDGPFAWFPWSGALFTNFFSHCWIEYARMGPDDPAAFGQTRRPRVDWWENSRRAMLMHQRKCALNPLGMPTFSKDAWGVTASDAPSGYVVPGLFPTPIAVPGATSNYDVAVYDAKDDFGDGTVAPYAAGCCLMFDPEAPLRALWNYRGETVWRDPDASKRQYGFQDAYNLGKKWVAPDCVAIDAGPLVLAIENARTGSVWKWFGAHPVAKRGYKRLGMGFTGWGGLGAMRW